MPRTFEIDTPKGRYTIILMNNGLLGWTYTVVDPNGTVVESDYDDTFKGAKWDAKQAVRRLSS